MPLSLLPFSRRSERSAIDDDQLEPGGYGAVEITEKNGLVNILTTGQSDRVGLLVKPHKESNSIKAGNDLLKSIHDVSWHRGENTSPSTAFELRYVDGLVNFQFVPEQRMLESVQSQLTSAYPEAHVERADPTLIDAQPGEWVSACELPLRKYSLKPIEHLELDGFEKDPFGSILKEMVGLSTSEGYEDVVVQVLFRPEPRGWEDGVNDGSDDANKSVEHLAKELERDTKIKIRNSNFPWKHFPWEYETEYVSPSDKEKKTAQIIRQQRGERAYSVALRVVTIADTPERARERTHKVAGMYRNYYESGTGQTFDRVPVSKRHLPTFLRSVASREFEDRRQILTRQELAGLAHIANDEVNISEISWMFRSSDDGVPPHYPSFEEYDQSGYTDLPVGRKPTTWQQYCEDPERWLDEYDEDSTPTDPDAPGAPEDAQIFVNGHEYGYKARDGEIYAGAWPRAMVENAAHPDVDQPLFIGVDGHGRPVPILYKELFRNLFAGGRPGEGKTTLALAVLNQLEDAEENAGATMMLAEEDYYRAARQLRDLSPENFVPFEPQNEYSEYETGFNFLETLHTPHIRGEDEVGFGQESEMLVKDLLSSVDADDFARMRGIGKNFFRSMIRVHNDPDVPISLTLMDMAFMIRNPDEYLKFVREHGLTFLIPQAKEFAEELDGRDREPMARRLQDYTEASDLRRLTSIRDGGVSIPDSVTNGRKTLVNISNMADDTRRNVTTAISRKVWATKSSQPGRIERRRRQLAGLNTSPLDGNGDHDELRDAEEHEPHILGIDELHALDDGNNNLGDMLAQGRKKRLGVLSFTQFFGQLDEDTQTDIKGTTASLFTGHPGYDDSEARALASAFSIDTDDLKLDRFHMWASITGPGGDHAEPFVTRLFPPPPPRRSVDEAIQKIDAAAKHWGVKRQTDEERLAGVPDQFKRGIIELEGLDTDDTVSLSEEVRARLYKAAYDAQIRTSDDPLSPGPIGYDELAGALRRTLAAIQDTTAETITDSRIESTKDQLKREHLHESSEYQYHVEPDGLDFLNQDEPDFADPRVGGRYHRRGVDHAYHWLAHSLPDCDVEIPDQGGETPDLVIEDTFELEGSALAARKQRQAFEANHPIRATLTMGSDTAVEFEHTTKEKTQSLIGKVTRTYEADEACLFVVWSTEDAETVHRKLTSTDAQREVPEEAHWHILVLPTGSDGGTDTPQLYVGPDADPSALSIEDVSPGAIDEALTSDLFDF